MQTMDNFTRWAIYAVIFSIFITVTILFINFLADSLKTRHQREPQNKIEYQLQDAHGRVIVSCRGNLDTVRFCIEKSKEVNK